MSKSPRYHIIIHIFTLPILGELVPSYGRKMATKSLHFLITVWFNRWRCRTRSSWNKVHAKNRKISFSRNFCSAIYTYSTVFPVLFANFDNIPDLIIKCYQNSGLLLTQSISDLVTIKKLVKFHLNTVLQNVLKRYFLAFQLRAFLIWSLNASQISLEHSFIKCTQKIFSSSNSNISDLITEWMSDFTCKQFYRMHQKLFSGLLANFDSIPGDSFPRSHTWFTDWSDNCKFSLSLLNLISPINILWSTVDVYFLKDGIGARIVCNLYKRVTVYPLSHDQLIIPWEEFTKTQATCVGSLFLHPQYLKSTVIWHFLFAIYHSVFPAFATLDSCMHTGCKKHILSCFVLFCGLWSQVQAWPILVSCIGPVDIV